MLRQRGEGCVPRLEYKARAPARFSSSVIYFLADVRSVFRVPFISSFTVLRHDLRGIRMKSDAVAFYVSSTQPILPSTLLCAPLSSFPVCNFLVAGWPKRGGETEKKKERFRWFVGPGHHLAMPDRNAFGRRRFPTVIVRESVRIFNSRPRNASYRSRLGFFVLEIARF